MVDSKVLNDEELKKVTGGVEVNGLTYKYEIGTFLKCESSTEKIIAEILNHAVLDGCPAYNLSGTKYYAGSTYTDSLQATLKESFLDKNGYYPM